MNSLSQGSLPVRIMRDEPQSASTLNELKKSMLFRMVRLAQALIHTPGENMGPLSQATLPEVAHRVADAVFNTHASSDWREGYTDR